MIYTIDIDDFSKEEEILEIVKVIIKMEKLKVFKDNKDGVYQIHFDTLILRGQGCNSEFIGNG